MFTSSRAPRRMGRVLAVAATAPAVLIALSACGSSGGGNPPAAKDSPTSSAPATTSGTPSTTPSTAAKNWQQALGAGVTVAPPGKPAPGHATPSAVVLGAFDVFNAKNYTAICPFYTPSFQAGCKVAFKEMPSTDRPFVKGFALGYAAIDGSKALVGWTGSICTPSQTPECISNSNPSALLSSGKPFSALWGAAVAALSSYGSGYALQPCVKVGSGWYKYPPSF